jgi:diamine N-acetyltransferase
LEAENHLMDNELEIRFADLDDINTIGYLAQQIWPTAYGSIITMDQITYMLNLFYTPASLTNQIQNQKHQFILAERSGEPVGFASFGRVGDSGVYQLHKLYVLTATQGKGVGKALLDFVTVQLSEASATHLVLNVNRLNPALKFYEKTGFSKVKDHITDIGNGYIMDDYQMQMHLAR